MSRILDLLFIMIATCYLVLYKKTVDDTRLERRCKIMIASCIIYDHIDLNGVFAKSSKIDVNFLDLNLDEICD